MESNQPTIRIYNTNLQSEKKNVEINLKKKSSDPWLSSIDVLIELGEQITTHVD